MSTATAQTPEEEFAKEFRDHVHFILQQEQEHRLQLDALIREQLIGQLRMDVASITREMSDLDRMQKEIKDKWAEVKTTASTQSTEMTSRIAEMADNIRKASEPIREYQLHAQKLQTALQSLTHAVEQNTREVAGVTSRALLGGALGGAAAAFLIFLFLHLVHG
jgi:chromosome segregation ATPase